MKKAWVISYPLSAKADAGRTVILLVLSRGGSTEFWADISKISQHHLVKFFSWISGRENLCIYFYSTWFEPRHDKTNKMSVLPAKTRISLGIRPVWSESSLCAQWVAKDPSFLHADSEDSDQTGRIWVFAGRTLILWVLTCRGSFNLLTLFLGRLRPPYIFR